MPDRYEETDPWYVRSFGELYPLLYEHRDEASARAEVNTLFEQLGLSGDEGILDLCCGAGRHMEAVLGLGFDVVGADLSPELLALARARSGLENRLVRADIRSLPFADATFDVVLNIFTSFGYFEDDEQNAAAFGEMARLLDEGGWLVIDHINREALEKKLVPESSEERKGLFIRQKRRIEKDRAIKETEVTGRAGKVSRFRESVRLFTPGELVGLCVRHHLDCDRIIGSFAGEEFSAHSARMIVVARSGATARDRATARKGAR